MQSNQKIIDTSYRPRPFQQVLHNNVKRFNVIVCHRRFGKTVWSVNEMIDRAVNNPLRDPQYAYIAPNYSQAKKVAWDMFKQFTEKFPMRKVHEQELRIDIPIKSGERGIRFMLLGAENPDSLRGLYLDGCILDEYASMYPNVWTEVIRPALSDRKGWACFVGTPKGSNHFKDVYDFAKEKENWYRCIFKASDTKVIDEDELKSAKDEMTEESYLQEYECDFGAALIGAYYGKDMKKAREEGRITTNVPYEKGYTVYTAWDLGIDDHTAIWFLQFVGREIRVIDYIEESGQDLAHYVNEIKNKEYVYEEHILPHDAGARELGTGVTRQETLRNLGLGRTRVLPRQKVEDGIHAVRMILSKCWFNEQKCALGIKALENYERKWDSKYRVFLQRPLHNWASHGADAFRTFAMAGKTESNVMQTRELPKKCNSEYDIFGV